MRLLGFLRGGVSRSGLGRRGLSRVKQDMDDGLGGWGITVCDPWSFSSNV